MLNAGPVTESQDMGFKHKLTLIKEVICIHMMSERQSHYIRLQPIIYFIMTIISKINQ